MGHGKSGEENIRNIAFALFSFLKEEHPALFDKKGWKGRVTRWAMRDDAFKIQLLRFIDVLPVIKDDALLLRLFREYFDEVPDTPPVVRRGIERLSRGNTVPRIIAAVIRAATKSLARQFIAGADPQDALNALQALRREGAALSIDLLGEAVVSDSEAERYGRRYRELLAFLAPRFHSRDQARNPADRAGHDPLAAADRLDISLKISSFYSQIEPLNWEVSIERVKESLRPLFEQAQALGASITFDMEHYYYKDLTIAVFKSILDEFPGFPDAGIALQAYLRDAREDVAALLVWAKEKGRRISVRLVKGAYWDYETAIHRQKGWPVPVFLQKDETDRCYEELTAMLLENTASVYPAFATHNIRSISNALALAEKREVPKGSFEFQVLYGMGDPVRKALRRMRVKAPVRVYSPVGELLPGMAYLVRRILENTSNESFLRKSFAEGMSFEELVRPPHPEESVSEEIPAEKSGESFRNEPDTDFSKAHNRKRMEDALRAVRKELGKKYPLFLGNEEVFTAREILSLNPACPDEVVGTVSSASREEAERAIREAKAAYAMWRKTPPGTRAGYLFRAAEEMRRRRFELAALEVYEAGKPIMEADGDVAEAIDYLEYYGRQITELAKPQRLGRYPAEINEYFFEPKGIGVVISPWNFPLAIPTGMVSAGIVAGNCMILKPSGLSPVVAWQLVGAFRAAGLPPGVLQYLPGPGGEVGEYLVAHPGIDLIAFTGSKEVGLRIVQRAGEARPGQTSVKRVVAEMGGKNAIIVDATADPDEAVKGVLVSALGYQGQKCSACSRVIVLQDVYTEFCERLKEAMRSIEIGPPESPSTFMGPLIDSGALKKVESYVEKGKEEGKPLLIREAGGEGYYRGPVLLEVSPDAVVAREEIFGPVLSVIRAADMHEAVALANRTEYALTGGIFSRSPATIRRAKEELRAGNLYINRKITGALVGRQPFGGLGMSGIGSKAGGPDYLLQFMNPKTLCENTLRKGVAPTGE
ncbi:MAG: L-glutamate gamma-semialdehyde dehydrogenase [Alphaproteobacteria bacterium]|uniref:L-glutamate gamma-semialdehyde dehydrogenase n=1 Tax=Candidatus Nitrobium versatile TaxID=2884831 RepID=A0A953LX71_9BACT|nr:L-glutamate gamma-semialdehyde dehydrogenase [Candidatus Nitrobium versatile]